MLALPAQLASLQWHVQPVTTYDIVHLFLPFMFCEYKYRAKLVQYVENITLAQALGTSHSIQPLYVPAPFRPAHRRDP
jgi:hypothetical protein